MLLFNHKKSHNAFTMIELIFVIVIMGIIGKFGVEFLAQAYKSYIYTSVNTKLEAQSEVAVEFIAARLQNRIKDSVIARKGNDTTHFELLSSANTASDHDDYTILEWDASDIDGFRSEAEKPKWSGILDINASTKSVLKSPETNATDENNLIQVLSSNSTNFSDTSIYFIGSNSNRDSWGWQDGSITDQNQSLHPIKKASNDNEFKSSISGVDFSNVDLYEYYKLTWTANAIDLNSTTHKLTFHYNYQPWEGEKYSDANSSLIMDNVSSFRFTAIGSTIKIQVCVKSNIIDGTDDAGGYSICKEKTIF